MEFTTYFSDLKVDEIKPDNRLDRYFELVKSDVKTIFTAFSRQESCPCCQGSQVIERFNKFGLVYQRCAECFTVFAKDRPSQAMIDQFYTMGEARKYWQENLWSSSEKVRIAKILQPTVDWMEAFVGRAVLSKIKLAELMPVSPGFYHTWQKNGYSMKVINSRVISEGEGFAESDRLEMETNERFGAFVLFQSLDRAENPDRLLGWASEHLEAQGLCFITGVLSTGLDALVLQDKLPSLLPPDRLNSFSFEGFQKLAERCGFEVLELSTPGALDIQNIKHAISRNEFSSPFFEYLLSIRQDEEMEMKLIEFLQLNRLSSHMRAVLRKK